MSPDFNIKIPAHSLKEYRYLLFLIGKKDLAYPAMYILICFAGLNRFRISKPRVMAHISECQAGPPLAHVAAAPNDSYDVRTLGKAFVICWTFSNLRYPYK